MGGGGGGGGGLLPWWLFGAKEPVVEPYRANGKGMSGMRFRVQGLGVRFACQGPDGSGDQKPGVLWDIEAVELGWRQLRNFLKPSGDLNSLILQAHAVPRSILSLFSKLELESAAPSISRLTS